MAIAGPSLYVQPAYTEFAAHQARDLTAALAASTKATLVAEVGSIAELKLGDDGLLRNGYRFTTNGLKQICTLICPGLYSLLVDVAGLRRDVDSPRDEYSLSVAVALYNRLLGLRSDRFFRGHRLVRDTKAKLVEGVLGPSYALVENSEVLARAVEAASARPGDLTFKMAVLCERLLMVRFVAAVPIVELDEDDLFHSGLHVINSEIGGKSTFRAALVLWRAYDDSYAMDAFLGGRRAHTGRRFHERVANTFAMVANARQDAAWLTKQLRALIATQLIEDKFTDDSIAEWSKDVESRLQRAKKIPCRAAQLVTAATFRAGAYGLVGRSPTPSRAALAARTAYDFFAALTHTARILYATSRDYAEQAAFGLLTGKTKLP